MTKRSIFKMDSILVVISLFLNSVISLPLQNELNFQQSEFTNRHNETRQLDKQNAKTQFMIKVLSLRPDLAAQNNNAKISASQSPPTPTPLFSTVTNSNNETIFPGSLDSYTPTCDSPDGVDREAWSLYEGKSMRIYFNVSNLYQLYQNDTLNIISAKLRLYKIGRGPSPDPPKYELPKNSDFCNKTSREIVEIENQKKMSEPIPILNIFSRLLPDKIFVKIYAFTSPVSRHSLDEKKHLETKTLLVRESGWIDFDVQKGVRQWVETGTNFGLSLEIQDEDDATVDAKFHFSPPHCIKNTTLSNNIVKKRSNSGKNKSSATLDNMLSLKLQPLLEICSLKGSFPLTTLLLTSNQTKFNNLTLSIANHRQNNSSTHHKHRHHHGEKNRQGLNLMQGDSPIVETTTRFFGPEHPLWEIFSTARSYMASRSRGYKKQREEGLRNSVSSQIPPVLVEDENNFIVDSNTKR